MKSALVSALENRDRRVPQSIVAAGESSLRCLRILIEDPSADFFIRRMAVWWGGEFNDAGFKAFLKKRFVEGKDKVKLFQKADSSMSEIALAKAGLYVAAAEDVFGKPGTDGTFPDIWHSSPQPFTHGGWERV
jgi:hypothetical protein